MKKTIAAIAVLASTNAYALRPPNMHEEERETVCLKTYKLDDKSIQTNSCDSTNNNKRQNLQILENGCAKGQVAVVVLKDTIHSCMPPGAVQL